MVIPKMARPAPPPPKLSIAPVPATASSAPAASSRTAPKPSPAAAVADFAPALLIRPPDSFLTRYWRWIAVAVIVIGAIVFTLLVRSDPGSASGSREELASTMSGGWTRRGVSTPGRVVSVYDPSRSEPDYRVEFAWVPDAIGVGWLFRIRDASNYYGARLSLLQPGASTALVVEHFGVVDGVESARSRKVVALGAGSQLRVRMEVAGPAFTLSAQGSPVDYWTDARLTSGPFGFYDERGQRPTLQTVRFTFFQKGAARVAVTSFR
jgi:hypothetical protein